MEGGLSITFISVAMFMGCFLLGFVPLLFGLSGRSLQFISILGAGLLCGTALAITVPEGVGLLEESWRASSTSDVPSPPNGTNSSSRDGGPPPRYIIGLALTAGFTFMFVVDQIASFISTRDQTAQAQKSVGVTATLGLVIHAAADGFALGAAVSTGQETVQVIVFLAVILHKAPTAFGLVSFLMHAGLEKRFIQGHLLAFSAASPIVAITTYFILQASHSTPQNQLSSTGVGMLFSGGTFLFVATAHVLPEISTSRTQAPPSPDPQPSLHQPPGAAAGTHQGRYVGFLESLTLISGVGIPVVMALWLQDD